MNNIYMQAALALSAGDVAVLQGELNGNTTAVLESTSYNGRENLDSALR